LGFLYADAHTQPKPESRSNRSNLQIGDTVEIKDIVKGKIWTGGSSRLDRAVPAAELPPQRILRSNHLQLTTPVKPPSFPASVKALLGCGNPRPAKLNPAKRCSTWARRRIDVLLSARRVGQLDKAFGLNDDECWPWPQNQRNPV